MRSTHFVEWTRDNRPNYFALDFMWYDCHEVCYMPIFFCGPRVFLILLSPSSLSFIFSFLSRLFFSFMILQERKINLPVWLSEGSFIAEVSKSCVFYFDRYDLFSIWLFLLCCASPWGVKLFLYLNNLFWYIRLHKEIWSSEQLEIEWL